MNNQDPQTWAVALFDAYFCANAQKHLESHFGESWERKVGGLLAKLLSDNKPTQLSAFGVMIGNLPLVGLISPPEGADHHDHRGKLLLAAVGDGDDPLFADCKTNYLQTMVRKGLEKLKAVTAAN